MPTQPWGAIHNPLAWPYSQCANLRREPALWVPAALRAVGEVRNEVILLGPDVADAVGPWLMRRGGRLVRCSEAFAKMKALPYPASQFGIILAFCESEAAEIRRLQPEFYRVMRPGGQALFIDLHDRFPSLRCIRRHSTGSLSTALIPLNPTSG